jgi:CHAD domain-containing protein
VGLALEPGENAPQGLRRIVCELLDEALDCLSARGRRDLGKRIHTARKRFKEVRAALRLARPAIGDSVYRRENRTYRDAAGPLSAVRDAAVLVEALDGLVEHFREELAREPFATIRRALSDRQREVTRRTLVEENALARVADTVRRGRRRIDRWRLDDLDHRSLVDGLVVTYRVGRRAMRAACDRGSDECLHEWRKQAKYLRSQAKILRPLWPDMMTFVADQGHELSDLLGDDHDLAVLCEIVRQELADSVDRRERQALRGLVADRRRTLQKHAFELGGRLYAEKPKAFARRMRHYLHPAP